MIGEQTKTVFNPKRNGRSLGQPRKYGGHCIVAAGGKKWGQYLV